MAEIVFRERLRQPAPAEGAPQPGYFNDMLAECTKVYRLELIELEAKCMPPEAQKRTNVYYRRLFVVCAVYVAEHGLKAAACYSDAREALRQHYIAGTLRMFQRRIEARQFDFRAGLRAQELLRKTPTAARDLPPTSPVASGAPTAPPPCAGPGATAGAADSKSLPPAADAPAKVL